jgi:hypothetical protein
VWRSEGESRPEGTSESAAHQGLQGGRAVEGANTPASRVVEARM